MIRVEGKGRKGRMGEVGGKRKGMKVNHWMVKELAKRQDGKVSKKAKEKEGK